MGVNVGPKEVGDDDGMARGFDSLFMQNAQLRVRLAEAQAEIAELKKRIAELEKIARYSYEVPRKADYQVFGG